LTKQEVKQEIKASPERIFAFVISERMNEVWGEWITGKWDTADPVGLGSTGHFETRGTLASFGKLAGTVTEFEPNKKMTMHNIGAKGKLDALESIILEPTANGTMTTYAIDYKVPYSVFGKLIDKVKISKEMSAMHVKTIENLKRIIET